MAEALVDPFTVAGVGLVHHLDDVRVLLLIAVSNFGRSVAGAIIHQYDLHQLAAGEQCFNAAVHVAFGIIAGYCKCNVFHIVLPTQFLRVLSMNILYHLLYR